MTFRAVNVLAIFIVGCGCSAGYPPEDAAAEQSNRRSVDDAIARAGFTRLSVRTDLRSAEDVTQPEVRTIDGKSVLVFPRSGEEEPIVVRAASGKVHRVSEIRHEVKEKRHARVCGCGPNASGGTARSQPTFVADVEPGDTYAGTITLVARGWIDLDYTYPEQNDRRCREIP